MKNSGAHDSGLVLLLADSADSEIISRSSGQTASCGGFAAGIPGNWRKQPTTRKNSKAVNWRFARLPSFLHIFQVVIRFNELAWHLQLAELKNQYRRSLVGNTVTSTLCHQ